MKQKEEEATLRIWVDIDRFLSNQVPKFFISLDGEIRELPIEMLSMWTLESC